MATLPYERKSTKHQTANGYSSLGRKSEGELSEEGTRFERETVIKQMGSSHLIRSQRLQKQVNLQTWDGLRLFSYICFCFCHQVWRDLRCLVCVFFFFPIQLLSFESLKLVFVCLFILVFLDLLMVVWFWGWWLADLRKKKEHCQNSEVQLYVVGLTDPVIVYLSNE